VPAGEPLEQPSPAGIADRPQADGRIAFEQPGELAVAEYYDVRLREELSQPLDHHAEDRHVGADRDARKQQDARRGVSDVIAIRFRVGGQRPLVELLRRGDAKAGQFLIEGAARRHRATERDDLAHDTAVQFDRQFLEIIAEFLHDDAEERGRHDVVQLRLRVERPHLAEQVDVGRLIEALLEIAVDERESDLTRQVPEGVGVRLALPQLVPSLLINQRFHVTHTRSTGSRPPKRPRPA